MQIGCALHMAVRLLWGGEQRALRSLARMPFCHENSLKARKTESRVWDFFTLKLNQFEKRHEINQSFVSRIYEYILAPAERIQLY